jgi:hypothetical protein
MADLNFAYMDNYNSEECLPFFMLLSDMAGGIIFICSGVLLTVEIGILLFLVDNFLRLKKGVRICCGDTVEGAFIAHIMPSVFPRWIVSYGALCMRILPKKLLIDGLSRFEETVLLPDRLRQINGELSPALQNSNVRVQLTKIVLLAGIPLLMVFLDRLYSVLRFMIVVHPLITVVCAQVILGIMLILILVPFGWKRYR